MKLKTLISLIGIGILLPLTYSMGQPEHMQKYRYTDTNMDAYKRGEKIYYGKAKILKEPVSEDLKTQQQLYLKLSVKGCPDSVKKKISKANLAGRLDEEQLESLKYYLKKRFTEKMGN